MILMSARHRSNPLRNPRQVVQVILPPVLPPELQTTSGKTFHVLSFECSLIFFLLENHHCIVIEP